VEGQVPRDSEQWSYADEADDSLTPWKEESADQRLSPPTKELLTVSELYARVSGALSQAFPEQIWVEGEIVKVFEHKNGHLYVDLADPGTAEDSPGPTSTRARRTAELSAVCWRSTWQNLQERLESLGLTLTAGRVVKLLGRPRIWSGNGKIQLDFVAIDLKALAGEMALARRRLLQALQREGLLRANASLEVPLVPLRIGLLGSPETQGWKDFLGQLVESQFGFHVLYWASLVQGADAPQEMVVGLEALQREDLDVIVIVRGGGSKGDLGAFDTEVLARAVASCKVPVWVGIGHTEDRSVVDEVANSSFITPTACGQALVERVSEYWEQTHALAYEASARAMKSLEREEQSIARSANLLGQSARRLISLEQGQLGTTRARMSLLTSSALERAQEALRAAWSKATGSAAHRLEREEGFLTSTRKLMEAHNPSRQLARGYSITRNAHGKVLKSVKGLEAGELISTVLHDGSLDSQVTSTQEENL